MWPALLGSILSPKQQVIPDVIDTAAKADYTPLYVAGAIASVALISAALLLR